VHINEFDYVLPSELIAQSPANPRDSSRMLVYERESGRISDRVFSDILEYLRAGDVLVLNTTRVRRARIFAKRGNADIEIFLHKQFENGDYEVLLKPARKVKVGETLAVTAEISGVCISKDVENGTAVMRFSGDVEGVGEMPLPHYIRNHSHDPERYQTVFNDACQAKSSASPTAGLHWTSELLDRARKMGVIVCDVLLHVGLGTFRPVKVDDPRDHKMHTESYEISAKSAEIIARAKREKRRVIAVGTTAVRTLETVYKKFGEVRADKGETNIFIYPPYKFGVVDAMVTNFHLPKSTLVMLICAFLGREKVMEIYAHAIEERYKFFSFGDACLFL